jgi:hypothetical protein
MHCPLQAACPIPSLPYPLQGTCPIPSLPCPLQATCPIPSLPCPLQATAPSYLVPLPLIILISHSDEATSSSTHTPHPALLTIYTGTPTYAVLTFRIIRPKYDFAQHGIRIPSHWNLIDRSMTAPLPSLSPSSILPRSSYHCAFILVSKIRRALKPFFKSSLLFRQFLKIAKSDY